MAENSKQKEIPPKFITYTAGELMNMNFPEPVAVIPDLLLEGISILAAPSKMGKSWLALNLALAVASGTSFLGYETIKSGVLYFALEDSRNRLASRLKSILGDAPPPDGLKLTTKCGVIDNEFFSTLNLEIQENNNLKLIIVDTLQKVRPVASGLVRFHRDAQLPESHFLYDNDFLKNHMFFGKNVLSPVLANQPEQLQPSQP